jgi:hypothetical protein
MEGTALDADTADFCTPTTSVRSVKAGTVKTESAKNNDANLKKLGVWAAEGFQRSRPLP